MIDYEYYENKYEPLPLRDANNFHTANPHGCCCRCDGDHASKYNRKTWKLYRKTQYVEKTPKLTKKRKCSTKEYWRSKGLHSNHRYTRFTSAQREARSVLRIEYFFNTYVQGQWILRGSTYYRINKVSDNLVFLDDGYDYTYRDLHYWQFKVEPYDYVTGSSYRDYDTGIWEGYKYFKEVA